MITCTLGGGGGVVCLGGKEYVEFLPESYNLTRFEIQSGDMHHNFTPPPPPPP